MLGDNFATTITTIGGHGGGDSLYREHARVKKSPLSCPPMPYWTLKTTNHKNVTVWSGSRESQQQKGQKADLKVIQNVLQILYFIDLCPKIRSTLCFATISAHDKQ